MNMNMLEEARKATGKEKAKGMDQFPDWLIHDQERWDVYKVKYLLHINQWINGKPLPKYMKQARVTALSK